MIDELIMKDLTPGMTITIRGAVGRYHVSYGTAQKALRRLWRANFLKRIKVKGRKQLMYEGVQERLL